MPLCTTADIDIAVNPNLATVASSVGFTIGDTVSVANAVGSGQDLITTITNIAGSDITLAAPASATITGEQFCRIGSGVNTRWFGPDGPCECGCACTCDEARDDYAHTSIAVSGGAAGATYDSSTDLQRVCFGEAITPATWAFPGVGGASSAIVLTSCSTAATSQVAIQQDASNAVWGGSASGVACTIYEALAGRVPPSFGVGTQQYITLSGGVTYQCISAVYDYYISVTASYSLLNPVFDTASQPTWAWVVDANGVYGTKTIGGVAHVFRMDRIYYLTSDFAIYSITLSASAPDPATTITLGAAPYDPFGLLVGTVTLTP